MHFALRKRTFNPARHVLEVTSYQNRHKIEKNRCLKSTCFETRFLLRFSSILHGFWTPKTIIFGLNLITKCKTTILSKLCSRAGGSTNFKVSRNPASTKNRKKGDPKMKPKNNKEKYRKKSELGAQKPPGMRSKIKKILS